MKPYPEPLDLSKVRVFPLSQRKSLSGLSDILVRPEATPPPMSPAEDEAISKCVSRVRAARERNASVILMYGAHLIKNGLMAVVNELVSRGWVTHLATNGAGTIHDWELAFQGRSEESVRENVANGCFGTWEETGRAIQIALLAGAMKGDGYGKSLGRYITEDGVTLPTRESLEREIRETPGGALTAARAELLHAMNAWNLPEGRMRVPHPNKASSIVGHAFALNVPLTVHPGIGYDIFTTHPMFNGGVIGRGGGRDFALCSRADEGLDGGVLLSVGSAIMAPQVFEKSLSVVNNLRLQAGRGIVSGHSIFVVDLQEGGGWDWSKGEPPKTNPAYYLRFCKTYARMHGEMHYAQCDNRVFLQNLLARV